ncbi:MAG: hypothetical protein IPP25_21805 [Saprospiraceae bacterium]|nr:hypothetical protein [Candidatus Opimibacter skivensis]
MDPSYLLYLDRPGVSQLRDAQDKADLIGSAAPLSGNSSCWHQPSWLQNFDDPSRMHHYASRDYASNFLESLDPCHRVYLQVIMIPTHCGMQEVEGIRRDVRIVNPESDAVDWYIEGLRRKIMIRHRSN